MKTADAASTIRGLALACALGGTVVAGQTGPISVQGVWPVDRMGETSAGDLLVLRDGTEIRGRLRNESLTLQTSYGRLTLLRKHVLALELKGPQSGLDRIHTVNNNLFSGFLVDRAFALQLSDGTVREVRREQALKAVLRGPPVDLPRGQFIQLKNGDCLTGKVLVDPVELSPNGGAVKIPLGRLDSFSVMTNRVPTARVRLRDGSELVGQHCLEDVPIRLDLGFTLPIYYDQIAVFYGREDWRPLLALSQDARMASAVGGSEPMPMAGGDSRLVWIPAGECVIGSPVTEADRDLDEGPPTKVIFADGFWIGKCEVTQAEYEAVTGENPSLYAGDRSRPVEKVSWEDAMNFCSRLTRLKEAEGHLPEGYIYRLPTEAEWEYACRAGTQSRFGYGDDPGYLRIGEYAWLSGNSESSTHAVGAKAANRWGIHDMHGNVWEWCYDNWSGFYAGGTVTNQVKLPGGNLRVARGGSWLYEPRFCRSANRDNYGASNKCSDLGFRVVLARSK